MLALVIFSSRCALINGEHADALGVQGSTRRSRHSLFPGAVDTSFGESDRPILALSASAVLAVDSVSPGVF